MKTVPFTVYEVATGKPLRTGHCLPVDLANQAGPGEALLPERCRDLEASVVADGKIVARPPELRSVQAKQARLASDLAGAEIQENFTHDGFRYPARAVDQQNMVQSALVGGRLWRQSADGAWEFADHSAAATTAVLQSFVAYRDRIRTELQDTTEAIAAAADVSTVETILPESVAARLGEI
jgi:hypothetical protein